MLKKSKRVEIVKEGVVEAHSRCNFLFRHCQQERHRACSEANQERTATSPVWREASFPWNFPMARGVNLPNATAVGLTAVLATPRLDNTVRTD